MNLSSIDLRQLECFCAVAKSGSFSKAAAVLGVGQPSLSRQVRKLEFEIGSQLFYRNGRGVALTSAGMRFYDNVSDIIGQLKSAYATAADRDAVVGGNVTLGLPTSISIAMGVAVLRRLRAEAPAVKLHLVDGFSGHVLEWLLSGRIDLAILHDARHAPAVTTERLVSEDLYLVGRDPLPFPIVAESGTVGMGDLAQLPLVLPGSDHGLRRKLDRCCAAAGFHLEVEANVDSFAVIRELILAGSAYSVLPISCVAREIDSGALRAWQIVHPSISNVMVLAAAQNRPFTRAMAEVRSALKTQAALVESRAPVLSDAGAASHQLAPAMHRLATRVPN